MRVNWGATGRKGSLNNYCAYVNRQVDKEAACNYVGHDLKQLTMGKGPCLIKEAFKELRNQLRKQCDIEDKFLPKYPRGLFERLKAEETARMAQRDDNPAIIEFSVLMPKLIQTLKDGLQHKQAPQVLFCLNYIIGLRPNDLNPMHVRSDGFQANADTNIILGEHVGGVVGTICNTRPSKQTRGKTKHAAYGTCLICDPIDYELVFSAVKWLFSPQCTEMVCNTSLKDYLNNEPSGLPRNNHRSECLVIFREMAKKYEFHDAVRSWGAVKPGFTQQLGRSFVACSVEQGRFHLSPQLRPFKAVELVLGHDQFSSNNINYLKLTVHPPKIDSVIMQPMSSKGFLVNEEKIQYGIYLVTRGGESREFT